MRLKISLFIVLSMLWIMPSWASKATKREAFTYALALMESEKNGRF